MLRVLPLKSLLPFFKFLCQLETKPNLFGSIFTALWNNFWSLKGPPGPRAYDFPAFFHKLATNFTFQTLPTNFWLLVRLRIKSKILGKVFNTPKNSVRWSKSPPVPWARDFSPFLEQLATNCSFQTKPSNFWLRVPLRNQMKLLAKGI